MCCFSCSHCRQGVTERVRSKLKQQKWCKTKNGSFHWKSPWKLGCNTRMNMDICQLVDWKMLSEANRMTAYVCVRCCTIYLCYVFDIHNQCFPPFLSFTFILNQLKFILTLILHSTLGKYVSKSAWPWIYGSSVTIELQHMAAIAYTNTPNTISPF